MSCYFNPADVIDAYSRADAIADGSLIDVSQTASERGFRIPVAITRAAWADTVEWSQDDNHRKGALQDAAGRLADVLAVLRFAIKISGSTQSNSRLSFSVVRVPRSGADCTPRSARLECVCGPGDDREPVLTIQLPGED